MIFFLLLNIFCKLIPLTNENFYDDLEHNYIQFKIMNSYCNRLEKNLNQIKVKNFKSAYENFLKIYNNKNKKIIKKFNKEAQFIFDAKDELNDVFN